MNRKIVYQLLPVVVVLLLFASCGQEDYTDTNIQATDLQEIRFEMIHTGAIATRVSTSNDGLYKSEWTDGDAVGIYIVKGSVGLLSSGNWVDNMKITYNSGTWSYTLPSGCECYPSGGDLLHFYAYYPYNAGVADPLDISFAVQTDQSSTANFDKSYLLTAKTENIAKSNNPVQLVFSHKLAMIELEVTNGGIGAQMSPLVATTLDGCRVSFSFNLSTGATVFSGSATSIKMYRIEQSGDADYLTSYTYRALVPAQTVAAQTELFRFSQGDATLNRKLIHKPTADVSFEEGSVKPYGITLSANIDPTHIYSVFDVYPHNGLPMGIVYKVSGDGKSGMILSLTEGAEQDPNPATSYRYGYPWGPMGTLTYADDTDNGRNNMATIKQLDADFTDYPAFAWVHRLNQPGTSYVANAKGIWYLQAMNELEEWQSVIWENYTWNTIDRVMASAGGVALEHGNVGLGYWSYYWSSTESDIDKASCLLIRQSMSMNIAKDFYYRVRAIMEF